MALDMASVMAERLRAERKRRGWPRLALAGQRNCAKLRTTQAMCHALTACCITFTAGKRGLDGPSERYQFLYCRAFNMTRQELFGDYRNHTNASVRVPESELAAEAVMFADGRIGFMFAALPPGLDGIEFQISGTITMRTGTGQDNADKSSPLVLVKSDRQASHEGQQTSVTCLRDLSEHDSLAPQDRLALMHSPGTGTLMQPSYTGTEPLPDGADSGSRAEKVTAELPGWCSASRNCAARMRGVLADLARELKSLRDGLPSVQSLAHMIQLDWETGKHRPGPRYRLLLAAVHGLDERDSDTADPAGCRLAISDAELARHYHDGQTIRHLAADLGTSYNTIQRHLSAQGAQLRPVGRPLGGLGISDAELARRYHDGQTIRQLAADLGTGYNTIQRRLSAQRRAAKAPSAGRGNEAVETPACAAPVGFRRGRFQGNRLRKKGGQRRSARRDGYTG